MTKYYHQTVCRKNITIKYCVTQGGKFDIFVTVGGSFLGIFDFGNVQTKLTKGGVGGAKGFGTKMHSCFQYTLAEGLFQEQEFKI